MAKTKKETVANTEVVVDTPAVPAPIKVSKKKAVKAVKEVATDAAIVTDAVPVEGKKRRKSGTSIEDIIELLKNNKVDKAIVALEKLSKTAVIKKERKSRPPTEFNLFVSEKMKELKDSDLSTNARMKECARLWKERKADVSN
jgi:hypothetical protein